MPFLKFIALLGLVACIIYLWFFRKPVVVHERTTNNTVIMAETPIKRLSAFVDTHIADTVLAEANGTLHAIQQSHRSWKQATADRTDSTQEEFAKEQAQEKQEQRSKAIALLKSRRSALSARIFVAQNEIESKGFPRDGGSHSSFRGSNGSDRIIRLSVDATQIQQLLKQRSQLEAQLQQIESL